LINSIPRQFMQGYWWQSPNHYLNEWGEFRGDSYVYSN
jgi:hypothetical protein